MALIAGAVVGYAVAVLVFILQEAELGAQIVAALLNMAVFAAVISYILQMVSFVLLRRNLPNIERPYISKLGVPGAVVAGLLAATALISIFLNEGYRPGVYGVAIYYVLGVLYFAVAGRNRLVLSPEEEFALTQGEQGVPQATYETSAAAQEAILRRRRSGGGTACRHRHRLLPRRASTTNEAVPSAAAGNGRRAHRPGPREERCSRRA